MHKQPAAASAILPAVVSLLSLSFALAGCGGYTNPADATHPALKNAAIQGTANPLVAAYVLPVSFPGEVSVEFGTDTTYAQSTSVQSVTAANSVVTTLVAGMKQNTTYHMRASYTYADGTVVKDKDHIFRTGTLPANFLPGFTTATTPATTPQPGVEMIDPILGSVASTAFATDLDGNVIWAYLFPDRQSGSLLYPIRLMPNGHMAMFIAPVSQLVATNPATPVPAGTLNVLREIDLAGTTIQQLTMADLNTRMAAAGFNVTLQLFSHDFQILPNGHWLIIANTVKHFDSVTGETGPQDVTGDVVIDLDPNFNPVWYWNEFDHFDVNRHPWVFPDWTHSNAVTYSPDDGNFLVSIRHQNWIVKVDYRDGAGTGNVIWKLGEGGDFQLTNGVDPTDWFYAQHNSVFASPNTTGIFSLALMDNGDDRQFAAGVTCGQTNAPACLYTTIPILQIDENRKTATFQFHQFLPAAMYSSFAGNTEVLANGNIEYDLAGVGADSYIYEVTPQANPLTVWQLHLVNSNDYRGYRMPSLYPGVQW